MARYYLTGYAPPSGITGTEAVRRLQRELGVNADGVWGPKSQAAYDRRTGSQDPFKQIYSSILERLKPTWEPIKYPSGDEIKSQLESYLRPEVDAAIDRREDRANTQRAQLDADAYARGMGSSTYVTSMKHRESQAAQDDIGELESRYQSTLSQRLYEALERIQDQKSEDARARAAMDVEASKQAYDYAMQWYNQWLNQKSAVSSGGKSRGGSAAAGGLTYTDYDEYVGMLSQEERAKLFNGQGSSWAGKRSELIHSLGKDGFNKLKNKYSGYNRGRRKDELWFTEK